EAQRSFAERRAFEHATGLTRVEAEHPEAYPRLLEIVEAYGAERGLTDRREAARRWHDEVWRPLSRRIRQLGLARRFPGDRSADILVKVATFRDAARAEGRALDWPEALEEFARANEAPGGGPGDEAPRRRALPLS